MSSHVDIDNQVSVQQGESVELLSRARDLIEDALSLYQDHESKLITEITDPHNARFVLADAIGNADRELLYNLPVQPDSFWNPVPGNSVRTRILCPPERAATITRNNTNSEIRVTTHPGANVAVIDRHTVIVHTSDDGHRLLVLRHPALVNLLSALVAHSWRAAEPLTHHTAALAARRDCPTTQQILRQLAYGSTDDAAARRLSMSVRTFRRHVADIMKDIDARSRFQAGIRLAQLGLAPAPDDLRGDDLAS